MSATSRRRVVAVALGALTALVTDGCLQADAVPEEGASTGSSASSSGSGGGGAGGGNTGGGGGAPCVAPCVQWHHEFVAKSGGMVQGGPAVFEPFAGRLFTAGSFEGTVDFDDGAAPVTTTDGQRWLYVASFDVDGKNLVVDTFANVFAVAQDLAVDRAGGVFLAGQQNGASALGDVPCAGECDFMARFEGFDQSVSWAFPVTGFGLVQSIAANTDAVALAGAVDRAGQLATFDKDGNPIQVAEILATDTLDAGLTPRYWVRALTHDFVVGGLDAQPGYAATAQCAVIGTSRYDAQKDDLFFANAVSADDRESVILGGAHAKHLTAAGDQALAFGSQTKLGGGASSFNSNGTAHQIVIQVAPQSDGDVVVLAQMSDLSMFGVTNIQGGVGQGSVVLLKLQPSDFTLRWSAVLTPFQQGSGLAKADESDDVFVSQSTSGPTTIGGTPLPTKAKSAFVARISP